MDTIEQLLQRGQEAQGGGVSQALLSAPEAERIIEQLAPLTIEEVGSSKWHTQHEWIERLNLQAHYNAQTHSHEFVVDLLVSLDKLHFLVHDLLLIEAWKAHVYPLLATHLAERVDSVTAYLLLYHEVTVANLLQVALYRPQAAECLNEDYALELADWCSRKLTRLNAEGAKLAAHRDHTPEELLRMSRLDEQEEKRREVEFSVCMCSLAILRYVTDSLPRLPMGALSRVVSTNDTLMGLLPLLDRPPWVRTRVPPQPPKGGAGGKKGGQGAAAGAAAGRPVLEKWVGNRWTVVPPADRLRITQTDGQVWLAVTNLLVEPRCRAKYGMDEFRRERILGLKRHLNELMFDQLPVLKDLQRVLDELALGVLPDPSGAGKSAALILEAVPVVRDAMLRGRNWAQVAEAAVREHFGAAAARMARERMEAMVKHLDFLCELEPEPPAAGGRGADGAHGGGAAAAPPPPPPPVKVSTWRKVHDSGVYESWYDFSLEVDDSRPPEPVEVATANARAGGGGGGSTTAAAAAAATPAVHGLRYRLQPLDVDSTRPLPANGKAVVRWGALGCEALLSLPELPTRDSGEGAAVLWVTVGLLAVDGVVLQIKLKKAPKPKERDRVAGVWYAYHPVAGALTVLREHVTAAAGQAVGGLPADAKAKVAVKASPVSSASGAFGGARGGGSGRPLVQMISSESTATAASKAPVASMELAVAEARVTSATAMAATSGKPSEPSGGSGGGGAAGTITASSGGSGSGKSKPVAPLPVVAAPPKVTAPSPTAAAPKEAVVAARLEVATFAPTNLPFTAAASAKDTTASSAATPLSDTLPSQSSPSAIAEEGKAKEEAEQEGLGLDDPE